MLLWRECGQHLVVVAWGGVTEKDRPESVDLELRVRGEGGEQVAIAPVDHFGGPHRPRTARALGVDGCGAQCVECLDHPAIAVPAHEDSPLAERAKPLDRLDRERTGHHITSDDDPVDTLVLDGSGHGVKRWQVGVNVVERGNAHVKRDGASASVTPR